jgi:hypothetical protein
MFQYGESVLKEDSIFTEMFQKSTYVIAAAGSI